MYRRIVFLENDDFDTFAQRLYPESTPDEIALGVYMGTPESGEALEYLKQWDNGDESEVTEDPPWGHGDTTFARDPYIMSYSLGHRYASLVKVVPPSLEQLLLDHVGDVWWEYGGTCRCGYNLFPADEPAGGRSGEVRWARHVAEVLETTNYSAE